METHSSIIAWKKSMDREAWRHLHTQLGGGVCSLTSLNGGKLKSFPLRIGIRQKMSTLIIFIECSIGSPSHGIVDKKRNKRNSNWKERWKTVTVCRLHDNIHVAAAAKLLQPCPTLCDPMDSSPPGSSVHRIL